MPSRRRSRNKNLGNNLADVQRRLRNMERRPVRTKLQNRVVTTAAIAVNAVGPDEVSFGTTVITSDPVNTIENPKDGLFVVNQTAGTTSVYSEEQGSYVALPAVDGTARSDAGDASDAADAAQATADGKNKIFRQNNAPTSAQGPTTGDLWYDQDDDNKMYRYTGSAWTEAVVLGNNALASISASKITAGTIDANVISVVNLNAANIATGNLSAARIATTALNANNITAGTISGITIQTSDIGTGRAIKISNEDDILFYTSNDEIGILTVVNTNYGGTGDGDTWSWSDAVVMAGLEGTVPTQGTAPFPFIAASGSGGSGVAGMFGSNTDYAYADPFGVQLQGNVRVGGPDFTSVSDFINFYSGYGADDDGNKWRVEISGPLVLSENVQGPLLAGTGTPSSANGFANGQIIFRYTA
jgi:hypothetical protein